MGYIRAEEALPREIIELIQQYVEGTNIYIPRRDEKKAAWGEKNQTRQKFRERNTDIYEAYLKGYKVAELSSIYFLSEKSIWRIVGQEKKKAV
ncbi:MAG: hypothetical protein J5517_07650 [Eubacterium sp.]|nr:hypothetical protein [Eubacterium sp.]